MRFIRYWTCRVLFRIGAPINVPLVGMKGDGRRDCAPPIKAWIDGDHGHGAVQFPDFGTYRFGSPVPLQKRPPSNIFKNNRCVGSSDYAIDID